MVVVLRSGGTNVWKLLSGEYGDYNVTRDPHTCFSVDYVIFSTGRRMVDVRRSAVHTLLLTSLRTRGNSFKSKCKMTMETTAKSESFVGDQ